MWVAKSNTGLYYETVKAKLRIRYFFFDVTQHIAHFMNCLFR